MTVQIDLAPEEVARLRDRAAAAHKDPETFAREAVLEKLDRPTLAELLAPIHEATLRSGMPEAEIDAIIERGRDEVWEERHGKAAWQEKRGQQQNPIRSPHHPPPSTDRRAVKVHPLV